MEESAEARKARFAAMRARAASAGSLATDRLVTPQMLGASPPTSLVEPQAAAPKRLAPMATTGFYRLPCVAWRATRACFFLVWIDRLR